MICINRVREGKIFFKFANLQHSPMCYSRQCNSVIIKWVQKTKDRIREYATDSWVAMTLFPLPCYVLGMSSYGNKNVLEM